jgi:hypothetical protein
VNGFNVWLWVTKFYHNHLFNKIVTIVMGFSFMTMPSGHNKHIVSCYRWMELLLDVNRKKSFVILDDKSCFKKFNIKKNVKTFHLSGLLYLSGLSLVKKSLQNFCHAFSYFVLHSQSSFLSLIFWTLYWKLSHKNLNKQQQSAVTAKC